MLFLSNRGRRPLRIAFVGHFPQSGGSANALFGYRRAAERRGHCDIRISSIGPVDSVIGQQVPIADADWKPDLVVIVFESLPYLGEGALISIERLVPRSWSGTASWWLAARPTTSC